jgi:hypothetical protein
MLDHNLLQLIVLSVNSLSRSVSFAARGCSRVGDESGCIDSSGPRMGIEG